MATYSDAVIPVATMQCYIQHFKVFLAPFSSKPWGFQSPDSMSSETFSACKRINRNNGCTFISLSLRSSIGGVAYVIVFNFSATRAATFRLRGFKCMLVIFVLP